MGGLADGCPKRESAGESKSEQAVPVEKSPAERREHRAEYSPYICEPQRGETIYEGATKSRGWLALWRVLVRRRGRASQVTVRREGRERRTGTGLPCERTRISRRSEAGICSERASMVGSPKGDTLEET